MFCFALFTFYPLISIHSNQALFPLCYWNCYCQGRLWTPSCQKQWLKFLSLYSALQWHWSQWMHSFLGSIFLTWFWEPLAWLFSYLFLYLLSQSSLTHLPFSDHHSLLQSCVFFLVGLWSRHASARLPPPPHHSLDITWMARRALNKCKVSTSNPLASPSISFHQVLLLTCFHW